MIERPEPRRAPEPVQAFAALHHHDYRWYFGTSLASMLGDSVEHVISYWVIFQAFHSPALAGFAVISHWLPFLVLSVWMGSLADRFDGRKLIQVSQALFMLNHPFVKTRAAAAARNLLAKSGGGTVEQQI